MGEAIHLEFGDSEPSRLPGNGTIKVLRWREIGDGWFEADTTQERLLLRVTGVWQDDPDWTGHCISQWMDEVREALDDQGLLAPQPLGKWALLGPTNKLVCCSEVRFVT